MGEGNRGWKAREHSDLLVHSLNRSKWPWAGGGGTKREPRIQFRSPMKVAGTQVPWPPRLGISRKLESRAESGLEPRQSNKGHGYPTHHLHCALNTCPWAFHLRAMQTAMRSCGEDEE